MCRLRNIAMRDYQESVTTGQTDGQTDRQTDAGQSDPYVPLCFAGDTKMKVIKYSQCILFYQGYRYNHSLCVSQVDHQTHADPQSQQC